MFCVIWSSPQPHEATLPSPSASFNRWGSWLREAKQELSRWVCYICTPVQWSSVWAIATLSSAGFASAGWWEPAGRRATSLIILALQLEWKRVLLHSWVLHVYHRPPSQDCIPAGACSLFCLKVQTQSCLKPWWPALCDWERGEWEAGWS